MTTTKPVNPVQLDREAAALPSTTHSHGLNYDSGTDRLWCVGMGDVCTSAATAYASHVAVFPAAPNANQVLMNALQAIPSTDGGYNVAQTVLKVLQGQPAVPAI